MKHKKIIILSLITVMFAAVISAFKVVPPGTAKAETTENVFQAKSAGVTVIDSDVFLEMGFDGYKSGDTVEENAVYAFMRTKDYSKYQKAAAGLAFESAEGNYVSSMSDTLMYEFTAASIKSALSAYCDDVTLASKNVAFANASQNNDNYFISTSSLLDRSYYAYMRAPSDLDVKYYYYSVKLSFTRRTYYNLLMGHNELHKEKLTSSGVSFPKEIASTRALIYYWLERCDMFVNHEYIKVFQQKLGIYTGNESMPVKVKYKYAAGFADIREKEETFTMNSLYAQQKDTAKYLMYRSLEGKDDITSFNCVYEDYLLYNDDNRELVAKMGEKILLQAKDIEYEYNGCESATLTVTYEPFQYSNFGIRVKSNDPAQNLSVDLYSAVVSTTEGGAYYTLTFNYSALSEWLKNKCGWLVTLNRESFEASGVIADNNETTPLTVTVDDKALTVGFYKTDQNALANLRVCVIAEIIPDHVVDYKVKYKKLTFENGNIAESDEEASGSMMYSGYINLSTFENFMTSHGALINDSVKLYDADSTESGASYFVPDSVLLTKPVFDSDSQTYSAAVTVFYTYRSIFRVKVNGNFSHFVQPNNSDNKYTMSDLLYTVPAGYRIGDIGCTEGAYVTFDDRNPDQAYVTFNSYSSSAVLDNVKVIDVILTVTDKLLVSVDYLENYMYKDVNGATKPSGFAVRKNEMKEVEASSFADVYSPTEAEIKTFLGVNDLTVIGTLGKVDINRSTVKKQGAVYDIELAYWHATLKVTQSTGEYEFLDVPLLSYGAWCEEIDRDWSLLALNTEENTVFTSNGDVDKSILCGYFYVSVFKEQVKNLDDLFAGYSADGCRTFFTAKKVVGSDLYKFCKNLGVAGFIFSLGGTATVQAIAEALNDDYGTYYSYFSFIDGSSVLSYAANNKADDYFDNDSAFDNTVEDVKDTVTNWWNSNNAFVKAMKIAFGIAGVALILLVILKILPVFIKAFGKIGKSVEEIRPDRRPKKRKRK